MAFLLILAFFSANSFAAQFEGFLTTYKSQLAISEKQTKKKYYITVFSIEIEQQLAKLKPNDFISFDGFINLATNTVEVFSINYVGLRDLLGSWSSDDIYCYEFTNFTEMAIYIRSRDSKCGSKNVNLVSKKKFMTYTINPASSGWLILMSGDSASYAGDLTIKNSRRIDLSLYDSETGDILRKIILRK